MARIQVVVGLVLALGACTASPQEMQAPVVRRSTLELNYTNSVVHLGTCTPQVEGGRLVMLTDVDGVQTVETLDMVLADCPVDTGVSITGLDIHLDTKAPEPSPFQVNLILDWKLDDHGVVTPLQSQTRLTTYEVYSDGSVRTYVAGPLTSNGVTIPELSFVVGF